MAETFMKIGDFRFSLDSATYQSLKHSQSYRWETQARIHRRPAKQFVGVGEETLEFTGLMYPKNPQESNALTPLSDLAEQGEPLLLVDGLGFNWGLWVILSISEDHSVFISSGVARKKSFSIKIQNYGEDLV